uniref:Uncharacterized protein n=1 Tax=Siphoviridae sp. cttFh17 TaxID=2826491 RepID=A0A8S5NI78_9CAUD|nr:MAG TPA: hypothetical protein [Siphoviridae sp. cttFh17]
MNPYIFHRTYMVQARLLHLPGLAHTYTSFSHSITAMIYSYMLDEIL